MQQCCKFIFCGGFCVVYFCLSHLREESKLQRVVKVLGKQTTFYS